MQSTILNPNTPDHVNSLELLNLKADFFERAGKRILQAYNGTTKHDAKIAAGMQAYLAAVRGLRDVLKPYGWEAKYEGSIELVTNKKLSVDILVSSGNRFIGLEEGYPGNKNKKGRNTQKIVYENAQQLSLFPEADNNSVGKGKTNITYFLFYHFDLKLKAMRMELALPTSFCIHEKRVRGWNQRMFFNSINFDGVELQDISPNDYVPEIEIEIKRKSNGMS